MCNTRAASAEDKDAPVINSLGISETLLNVTATVTPGADLPTSGPMYTSAFGSGMKKTSGSDQDIHRVMTEAGANHQISRMGSMSDGYDKPYESFDDEEDLLEKPPVSPSMVVYDCALFCLGAIGYMVCWTGLQSLLGYYAVEFYQSFFLELNAVYFLPSLPILWLQQVYDAQYDAQYGRRASFIRFTFSFLGAGVCTAALPLMPNTPATVLTLTGFIGAFNAIAFGASYQLTTYFNPLCTVGVSLGYVGAGPVVLIFTLALSMDESPSEAQRVLFLELLTVVSALGYVAFYVLLFSRLAKQRVPPRSLTESQVGALLDNMGGEEGSEGDSEALFSSERSDPIKLYFSERLAPVKPLSMRAQVRLSLGIIRSVWKSGLSLFISMFCSILVYPFFPYLPAEDSAARLCQTLFFIKVIGDIVGRVILFVPSLNLTSPRTLLMLAMARLAMLPVFFLYIGIDALPRSDLLVKTFVGVYWVMSGYVNTSSFKMAPTTVDAKLRPQTQSLMTFIFQCSILTALVSAFILRYSVMLDEDDTDAEDFTAPPPVTQ